MNNFRRRVLSSNVNGEEYVDLGLPSGLLWAKGNLKKSGDTVVIGNETDYGDFWSWANVGLTNATGYQPSSGGKMTQAMYDTTTGKQLTGNIPVNATYDVPRNRLGYPWRLPTKTEFEELYNNTDHEWTTIKGIYGQKFKKKNYPTVYVFFPASGTCNASGLRNRGSLGYYWSSTYYSSSGAYYMYFTRSSVNTNTSSGYCGLSVRAVQ